MRHRRQRDRRDGKERRKSGVSVSDRLSNSKKQAIVWIDMAFNL